MDILSSRQRPTSGFVTVNGRITSPGRNYNKQAYVSQSDILIGTLSTFELLSFSAMLRLPNSISKEEKMIKVENIVQLLGLSKVRNTRIGDRSHRGLSGGEMKRVSIGIELLTGWLF